ncbi:MAG TPA: hypothetical protein DCY93_03960 [Firmicutes bacterium]|nr:hypothetical protein [Bacillota bacterium]
MVLNAKFLSETYNIAKRILSLNFNGFKKRRRINFVNFKIKSLNITRYSSIKNCNKYLVIPLIKSYIKKFDYFSVIKMIEKSNDYDLNLILALIYLYQRNSGFLNIKLGEQLLIKLVKVSSRVEAIIILIEFYLYSGNDEKLIRWCKLLEKEGYGTANYYLSLIETNYQIKVDECLNAVTARICDNRGYARLSELTSKKKDFALLAIRKNILDAYALLGEWCYKMNDFITMKHLFDSGIERENTESLKCLVNFYIRTHDYEGISEHFHSLMMKLELNQRLVILEKLIKLHISDEHYDKAARLSKFYLKYDEVSASFLLAMIYEKQKKFDKAFNIYSKLANEYKNKYAMCNLGLYYIHGYGTTKIDEKKGLSLLQNSGTSFGKEIIDICSLKGVLGKEKVLEGFENLNQNVFQSPIAALYIFACYHFGYCVSKDIIEEERLSRLLKEEHKKTREDIITFLLDNRDLDLSGSMLKKERLSHKILF